MLDIESLDILKASVKLLDDSQPNRAIEYDMEAVTNILNQVAVKMQDNYPYNSPRYLGQMLKPPHVISRLAYSLAMYVNPNNHALDGGKASSAMEKDSVKAIANMFGWGKEHLGHLTGGGTMANLEALWISGQLHPNKKIVASKHAHYTHQRISNVLGLPYESVDVEISGKMDLKHLEELLSSGEIATVVVTMGTTGIGCLDPLDDILALREKYHFRIHVDAAYGGYFILSDAIDSHSRKLYALIQYADSVVIDPHKHGLQPYGCGCILFKNPEVARFYLHDSPYTYFTSDELHLGEISLECSRPGAAAVALWATQQLLPLLPQGEFAHMLNDCHHTAVKMFDFFIGNPFFIPLMKPELDIIVWGLESETTKEMSDRSVHFFNAAEKRGIYLSLYKLNTSLLPIQFEQVTINSETVTLLRSCTLKPELLREIDALCSELNEIAISIV